MTERIRYNGACYDCGSTVKDHHTPLCDLAPKRAKRDLPQIPGTQYWAECVDAGGNRVPPEKRPTKL